MRNINTKDIETSAIVAVFISIISVPYLDWWGFLVGPTMVFMFAWAYYSMAFVVWAWGALKRLIFRA